MALQMHPVTAGWDETRKKVHTHCSYCALQCGMTFQVDLPTDRVLKVRGRRDFPTTRGLSCIKGQTAHHQLHHPDRLTHPLLRDPTGAWRKATWDEALDFTASRLKEVRAKHGPDANAVFGSGALTNESVYLLGKFARLALKTKNIDYNGRYCMSSAAAAQNAVFGLDRGLHFPLADLQKAGCILLVGGNVNECLPPVGVFLRRAQKNGTKVIVVDPRATDGALEADLHLAARPGTDLALANALLHEVHAAGGVDWDYVTARTDGMEQALEAVKDCDAFLWAEKVTGVPANRIRRAAHWLMQHKPSLILTGRGAEQHAKGPETVMAFINVALALGQVGVQGGGFGTLTGQGNGQGGREQGQKADQLVGYRSIENPADRAAVASFWGVPEAEIPGKGLSAQEILQAGHRHEVRSLWVVASNPAVSAAKGREVRETLASLDFLAVSDLFLSETCEFAHVVFPATAFAEEEGTMTNIEGRVVLRRAAVKAPGSARPDWKTISALAERLGAGKHFNFHACEAVFNEFAAATAGGRADYSGMTYGKLERHKGLFWPCPAKEHPGTPRLFEERFQHAGDRAKAQATPYRPSSEEPDAEYPYRLTTGRVLQHYLSGNQTRRIPTLNNQVPRPYVQVGAGLAKQLDLKEGQPARLRTRRGEMVLPVRILAGQEDSTLFVPMHFGGEGSVNALTQDALSPLSKMPEFKACAAQLSTLS
jgi:assimilatory nitrate reductase catalytic subunit